MYLYMVNPLREMNDIIAWRDVEPSETIAFWRCYMQNKPLPPPAAMVHTAANKNHAIKESSHSFLGAAFAHPVKGHIHRKPTRQHSLAFTGFAPNPVSIDLYKTLPYNAIGKLLFALVVEDKWLIFEGTAFVLDIAAEQVIFTAAHCLFSERHLNYPRQWAQHLIFIPNFAQEYRSLTSYFEADEVFFANSLGVPRQWCESGFARCYDYDWGCICLAPGGAALREKTGALSYLTGDFDTSQYIQPLSIGYPVGEGFDNGGLWETHFEIDYLQYVGGNPHIRMKGNRLSAGASGGPVLITDVSSPYGSYVIGINAYSSNYGNDFPYWDSPRFGSQFLSVINTL